MGVDHCAWLDSNGFVWTSGENQHGQLGFSSTDKNLKGPFRLPDLPAMISVQTGSYSTFCLDKEGKMWSFGFNNHGQLGTGDTNNRFSPYQIPGMPPVRTFSSGRHHNIVLCEDGSLWAFGCNMHGQLGLSHKNDKMRPVRLPASCFFDQKIAEISCGYRHSLFLSTTGQVFSCGSNGRGRLGLGDTANRYVPNLIPNMNDCIYIICGGYMSCMVDSSLRLWVCGSHTDAIQASPIHFSMIGLVQKISIGFCHVFCINQKGELWGWGHPRYGQLGNESAEPLVSPTLLQHNISHVLAIGYSTFIQNSSKETFCCGKNISGQLGLGDSGTNYFSFKPFTNTISINFQAQRRLEKEVSLLKSVLPGYELAAFVGIQNTEKVMIEYLCSIPGKCYDIRPVGWQSRKESLQSILKTITKAGATIGEDFAKKSASIQKINDQISWHEQALKELRKELEVQQSATGPFGCDFTMVPKKLLERVDEYVRKEMLLNEELMNLLARKSVVDLGSCELGILLWKMDLQHVYPMIKENKIDGKLLCSLSCLQMVSYFGILNQEAYTMKYYLDLMQCSGYNAYIDKETDCPVCSHTTPEDSIALMQEHKIPIDSDLIQEGRWNVPQIIYSESLEDFKLSLGESLALSIALSPLKDLHQAHLLSLSCQSHCKT